MQTKDGKFDSYPSALDALARKLKTREFEPDEYHIVLTPDRYTQSAERALFSGGGALDCEVLTLSRLARRIAPNDKVLSREGGVMLTARAVAAVEDKLEYYGHAAQYNGFARDAYDAMQQLRSSGAEPAELYSVLINGETVGATGAKLADLARIREKYIRLKNEFADPSDRLTELVKAIPTSELIKRAHVYAVGYSLDCKTTELNRRVFAALEKHAASFEYCDVLPPTARRGHMMVFSAPDRVTQYKEIAVRIRDHAHRGGKLGDVFVVCPEPRALARILREYGIAFYHDERTPLECTPPLVALDNIYKLKSAADDGRAVDGEVLLALCKNPFSRCDDFDAQELQKYLSRRKRFLNRDFKPDGDGAVRAVERARTLVGYMRGDFCAAVKNVVEQGGFEDLHAELYGDQTDTVKPILELVELLERYGTGDFHADAKAFFSAAHAVEIKSLPRYADRVTVTVPQNLRMTRCGMLLVADFNEGVLPAATSDCGLLGDDELCAVNAVCAPVEISPTVREQNRRERIELKAVVNNADEVFCSYITAGRMRPSAFIAELAERIDRLDCAERDVVLANTDDARYIARYACTRSAARELAARGATKYSQALRAAAGDSASAAAFAPVIKMRPRRHVSVSELSDWFSCPYKRFLRDAVGVKERRSGALGAPDFGTVVHEFMKEFIDDRSYDCSRERVKRSVDDILAKKGIEPEPYAYERLLDDAEEFAKVNVRVLEAGDYTPLYTERAFDGLTLGDSHKTEFVGVIDRIDECDGKLRIIDYKTGATEFKLGSCLLGTDMQLPLYAYATGASDVTGFFYAKLAPRYDNRSKPLDGCFVRDTDTVVKYDGALAELRPSTVLSVKLKRDAKTGELSFNEQYKAGLPSAAFDALIERCKRNASIAVDEMADGNITRSPIDGACSRCAFHGVCGDGIPERSADVDLDLGDVQTGDCDE